MIEKFISADSHVVEPADLWTIRMNKRFRDRAPRSRISRSSSLGRTDNGARLLCTFCNYRPAAEKWWGNGAKWLGAVTMVAGRRTPAVMNRHTTERALSSNTVTAVWKERQSQLGQ